MKRNVAAGFGFLIAFAAATSLFAKGIPTRITIDGANLATPIEINDQKLLDKFNVWAGAGVKIGGIEQADGFIIDWSYGVIAAPPGGLRRYDVSFFVKYSNRVEEQLAYIVFYAYDPSTEQGYIYLPGKGDKGYVLNTTTIHRRREGNWFRATGAWQEAVKPLIARVSAEVIASLARKPLM